MPSLQTIALSVTIGWSVLRLVVGIRSFADPRAFAKLLTLDSESSDTRPNPFIPLFNIRGIAIDGLILFYAYQQRSDIVGAVVLSTVPVGVADALVTWRYGKESMALVHAMGSCVIAALGYILYGESFKDGLPVLARP